MIGVPEKALGWLPLGLGLVMEDEPSEFSCSYKCMYMTLYNTATTPNVIISISRNFGAEVRELFKLISYDEMHYDERVTRTNLLASRFGITLPDEEYYYCTFLLQQAR